MLAGTLPYVVMAVMYGLSSLSGSQLPVPQPFPHFDKVVHGLVYGLLLLSYRPAGRACRAPGEWLPGAIVASLVFAGSDEIHQSWVPGRSAELADLAADAMGILATALVVARWSAPGRCRILEYT